MHAADKLCAYLKCMEEVAAGNREFSAPSSPADDRGGDALPEVRYFLTEFAPSLKLSLDELA